jgi:alkylation response protein AidB-like acyl-CoA dehydrogenase
LDQVLSRITALAPMVARLASDIEQGRRLPAELVSALRSARIYGMLVPRRYGGLELDPSSAFRAVTALARLDGSVGWNAILAAALPGSAPDAPPGRYVAIDFRLRDDRRRISGGAHYATLCNIRDPLQYSSTEVSK